MPNYIKALILLLIAVSISFMAARLPFLTRFSKEEYREYRNTWLFLTVCLFLAPGIWIFYAIAAVVLLSKRFATDGDRVALYCFLLFVIPSVRATIPGVGGIETFFHLDFQRLLIIIILLPALKRSLSAGLSFNPADKYVALYFAYSSILLFRDDNFTNSLRELVTNFVDVIVPYFVISRSIKTFYDMERVLLALMFTLSLIGAEAIVEAVRHWELYNQTGHRLIGQRIFRFSGERAGLLRARSIFMSPIMLAYAMLFLLLLLLYFKPLFNKKGPFYLLMGIAGGALIVSFSRGPWIGAALAFMVYQFIGKGFAHALGYVILGSAVGAVLLVTTEFGRSLLNLLPFFGGTESAETFDYRAKLLENGLILVRRNPLFGDHRFLQTPEMEEMRQGQGIIDTVNVYLTIAMYKGLIGLFLFVMIFFPTMFMIYRRVKTLPASEKRLADAGRMLISYMAGALFIIATVSNAGYIPIIYYLGAALMASWIGIHREYERRATSPKEVAVRANKGRFYVNDDNSGTVGL